FQDSINPSLLKAWLGFYTIEVQTHVRIKALQPVSIGFADFPADNRDHPIALCSMLPIFKFEPVQSRE
ncbi:hypothetical protein, partial [Marinospirillum sp.]|uniref:hypothetical protein n=1 Tax=Marinospirillum sp. TaxID=2183934 RepID=UPI0025B8A968